MNKDLEALNKIQHDFGQLKGQELVKCYETIFNSLKRLESIDNSNPSEAMKYVNGKIADLEDDLQHYTMVDKDKCREFFIKEDLKQFTNIKQALLKSQEQEKVLSIIKEKNVDIIRIKHLIFKSQKNPKYWDLRYYNEVRVIDDEKLTQEEFDLLKRCLG